MNGMADYRSIQWRLKLGLLRGDNQEKSTYTKESFLFTVANQNQTIIYQQRQRYEGLAQKHYRQSCALSIINDSEHPARSGPTKEKKVAKTVVDDPLSIMASFEEEKLKIDQKKALQRKKEIAMASRPNLKHHPMNTDKGPEEIHDVNSTKWDEFYSSREIMDIIDKDLERLPIDHHIHFHQRKTNIDIQNINAESDEAMKSRKERNKQLAEILFVYAKEHEIGYRQGMHEILSYIFMAYEIDMMNYVKIKTVAHVEMDMIQNCLLNSNKIIHDCYALFDAIMSELSIAFEYSGNLTSRGKVRERLGIATLTILREWQGDNELADFISELDVPPELYVTRWVRLMFSREVTGFENVFKLWDHFLGYVSQSVSLLDVLETAAASMIIMVQDKILPQHGLHNSGLDDDQEPMHILMNYPRLMDINPFIIIVDRLMTNQATGFKPPKVQRSPQYVGSADYMLPNQAQIPFQGQDTVYFSQGPVDYSHQYQHNDLPMMSNPQQQYYQNVQHHQDPLLSTLKNIQTAPALKKLSLGLNEGVNVLKGVAKDALHTIDSQLLNKNQASKDNIYRGSESKMKHQVKSSHINDVPLDSMTNDSFLGYRNVPSAPSVIDEDPTSFTQGRESIIDSQSSEGSFVGVTSTATNQATIAKLPNTIDETPTISQRMGNDIAVLRQYLQSINVNNPQVWSSLSNLEALQQDMRSKYKIVRK